MAITALFISLFFYYLIYKKINPSVMKIILKLIFPPSPQSSPSLRGRGEKALDSFDEIGMGINLISKFFLNTLALWKRKRAGWGFP